MDKAFFSKQFERLIVFFRFDKSNNLETVINEYFKAFYYVTDENIEKAINLLVIEFVPTRYEPFPSIATLKKAVAGTFGEAPRKTTDEKYCSLKNLSLFSSIINAILQWHKEERVFNGKKLSKNVSGFSGSWSPLLDFFYDSLAKRKTDDEECEYMNALLIKLKEPSKGDNANE